jgi:cytochrome P450
LFIYLGANPRWRAKAAAEVKVLLSDRPHPPRTSYSLSAHLATIPLETWESETPVLDLLIRETLRLAQPHTAMRKNIGPDVRVGNEVIPTGAYVVYPFSDVHLNADYYPDPWRFDPSRNQDIKAPFGYVGWGAGGLLFCSLYLCS